MATFAQLNLSLGKLKAQVNNATNKYTMFIDDQNKLSDTLLAKPHKESLRDSLKSLILAINSIKTNLIDFEKVMSKFESQDYENISEKVLEKFSSKLIEQTKNELIESLPKAKKPSPMTKKVMVSNDQTLILGINRDDIESVQNNQKKSFSAALKENLNEKLKDIPVTTSAVNKHGKAILTFPTAEVCLQAKSNLQSDFNVTFSDRKPPIVQPRLKINHLVPELTVLDKEELRNKIISKNDVLKNANESEFNITFIEKTQNYAVAKMSPKIFHALDNNGRIFIDLRSYQVTEHFHPIQCYKCQSFGHTSSSQACNVNDMICLYCSKNHKSSECPSKKNKDMHNCSNCHKSMNSSIKNKSNTHTSTSKSCPIYIKEVEKLKQYTCYDQKVYIESKNQ